MICGMCSREQAFSPTAQCKFCAFAMGSTGSRSHWNGGGGMRDTTRLDKKDKKHTSVRWAAGDTKGKTVSRKKAAALSSAGGKKKKKKEGEAVKK